MSLPSARNTSQITRLERRQPELVSAVLHPENAEQEAVHAQQHTTPDEHGNLLRARIHNAGDLERERDSRKSKDAVNRRNDLRLEAVLVTEAAGKVDEPALAIALHIRCLPDMIEHVPASKQQHGNQAKRRPEIAVLQDWYKVRPRDCEQRNGAEGQDGRGADLDPVDGARDGGLGGVGGDLARDPGVDLLGGLRAGGEVEADGLGVGFGVGAGCGVEVEQDRGGLEHHLCGVSNYYSLLTKVDINGVPYRLESILSVHKVEGAEKQPSLALLVALGPALAQNVPLGLEFPTQLALESLLQRSEEDGDRVVSRGLCQLRIACIVKFQWSAARQ